MDGFLLSQVNSATIRMHHADRDAATASVPLIDRPGDTPVDTIELTHAIRAPQHTDEILLSPYSELHPSDRPGPSLTTILEAIKRFVEQAVEEAHRDDQSYFERLQEIQDQLQNAGGVENLMVAGELVAAAHPAQENAFLTAAQELVGQALDPAQGLLQPGSSPADLKVSLADLKLGVLPQAPDGLTVSVDALRLTVSNPSATPAEPNAKPATLTLEGSQSGFTIKRGG